MTRRLGYFETAPVTFYFLASLAGGLLICWPLLLHGGPLLFFDSGAYLTGGQKIMSYIIAIFTPSEGSGGAAPPDAEQVGQSIRSIFYAFYVYVTSRTVIEYSGPVLIQAMLVTSLLLLLLPDREQINAKRWLLGGLALLLLTSLPFYASLLMPDLLAAAIILACLIMVRGQTTRATVMSFVALTVAIASHYGNLPLALVLVGLVLVWLAFQKQLGLWQISALIAPFIIATSINVLGSAIAFDSPSTAPRRLPILLARSLEDGPARWHLNQNCDRYDYAICTAIEKIPENVSEALWEKGGLADIQSAGLMEQIRAQERIILQRAFLEYPFQQTWSLARNFATQLIRFGLSDVYLGKVLSIEGEEAELELNQNKARNVFDGLEIVHIIVILISLIYLARLLIFSRQKLSQEDVFTIWFLGLGLLANAAIFGGLSAPVDRYQGRIIWLVPFLVVLFWARRDERT